MTRVLCVAEKPSIAKAVAGHLAGGNPQTVSLPIDPVDVTDPRQRETADRFTKNYTFDFNFGPPWNSSNVTMTAVRGHLTGVEPAPEFKKWQHPPPISLFTAPIVTSVPDDKTALAENIKQQARYSSLLIIWTDCDREGEYIGKEIVDAARKGNARIQVKRARFNNIERSYVFVSPRVRPF